MLQLMRVTAVLLVCANCGGQPIRDFYTPEERASVVPPRAETPTDAGSGPFDAGMVGAVVESGIERFSKPCPDVVAPKPGVLINIRCVNRTSAFLGYESVADNTCGDLVAPIRQVLAPNSDAPCQVTRNTPTKVIRVSDSTELLFFRTSADNATLVVE